MLLHLVIFLAFTIKSHASWIDPDTSDDNRKAKSFTDGKEYDLVMSDEFNKNGRSFHDGHDPMWTAIERSDDDQTAGGKKSLQYYNSSNAYTEDGRLVLLTTTEDTSWKGYNPYAKKYTNLKRHFRSAMVQSWNKFCFTGGIFEADIMLPGAFNIGGLWPAVWLLGNLGRATYEGSTNLVWPWSYTKCNRAMQKGQLMSGCDETEHYELNSHQGRGATEIDIVEVMPGTGGMPVVPNDVRKPYNSMTLQLAPGIPAAMNRPAFMTLPQWPGFTWYGNLTYGPQTSVNPFFYGTFLGPTSKIEPVQRTADESYQCDAISAISSIKKSFWEGMHTFRLEWQPGPKGYLHWYIDGVYKYGVEQEGLDFMGTDIPNEPSSIIFNTAISTSWGFPEPGPGCTDYDCKTIPGQCGFNPGFCATLPAKFMIDHIRVYQNKNDSLQTVGCNPEGYPTSKYIEANAAKFRNPQDKAPLKKIVTGGGRCDVHSNETVCGEEFGNGKCIGARCVCSSGWVGPRCLVPSYKDDGTPWDAGIDEIPPVQPPQFPSALEVYTGIFAVFFCASVVATVAKGPSVSRVRISNWL